MLGQNSARMRNGEDDIDIGVDWDDVSNFIVVLSAEILESYVEGPQAFRLLGQAHHRLCDGEGVRPGRCDPDGDRGNIGILRPQEAGGGALAIMFRHQKWTKSMGRRAEPSAKMVEHSLEVCVGGS